MIDNYFIILPVLGAALCVGLGLFTLSRNPKHLSNIGFAAGMASLAVFEAGSAMLLISTNHPSFARPGMRIMFSGEAALPAAWLLFCLVFARANYREILSRWAPALVCFGAMSAFFIFLTAATDFISMWGFSGISLFNSHPPLLILGRTGRYFYMYLLIGLVVNLMHLENTLRSSSGSQRWRIKYVILGVGSILGYFIYLSSEALLYSSLNYGSVPLVSSIIIISTAMMAVFIAKNRLLHVDIFVSRHVIYNSLTVLVVGAYLVVIGASTYGIRYFKIPFDFFLTTIFAFVSILALVILLFADSVRRRAQLFISRHFYSHKYEFRDKWMETIEKISTKTSVEEIASTLKEMISGTMGAESVRLWLYDAYTQSFASDGAPGELGLVPRDHPLAWHIMNNPSPLTAVEAADISPGGFSIKAVFDELEAELCSPLTAANEAVGFVMLGPDHTGEPYIEDDLEFLKAVTTQAAVQIKNITLTTEILAAREVEAFSKMSYFVMHDLKNLTNSLSLISQNARFNMDNLEFQRDAIKTIDGTVARMKKLIGRLSNIKKDFELKKEWTDVGEFMGLVLKKLALPKDKNITVMTELCQASSVCIDREAVEMIILNLMVNAYEAISENGTIKVAAALKDGFINIAVSDNGPGIPKEYIKSALFQPFRTTKKNGFGIGLFQCKAVAEAHGGGISVESVEGKGASFILRLPACEDLSVKENYPAIINK